jgi:anti-sigma factor RsiW
MPACADRELLLNAFVDDELDAANTAAVEAHLASCHDCREATEQLRRVHHLVGGPGVRHSAPDDLRQRVLAAIHAEESPVATARPSRRTSWIGPALGGAIAATLAMLLILPIQQRSGLEDELVAGHVRSLQVQHLTDVQTSNQHLIRPWFNGKIDFAPPVPELAAQGFPLAGGRLDYLGGKTVAAIVYKRRLHSINLFVWPSGGGDRRLQRDGYSIDEWTKGGLRFAAVSDISPAELEQFRQAFMAASASS